MNISRVELAQDFNLLHAKNSYEIVPFVLYEAMWSVTVKCRFSDYKTAAARNKHDKERN